LNLKCLWTQDWPIYVNSVLRQTC